MVENLYWTGEEPKEEIEEIISQLQKHRNEINNTTTFLWETVEQGWGGDSESRIWHRYSDAYIRQYMGLPEDAPLTDEIIREFKNKALNATSQETTIVRYEGEQFEITKEFELI